MGGEGGKEKAAPAMEGQHAASWRLNVSDFHMPERPKEPPFVTRVFLRGHVSFNGRQWSRIYHCSKGQVFATGLSKSKGGWKD
ncbi:hypothetical protein ACP70R_031235 [Stipagrostis hirtigluma subsp. patula]